MVERPFSSDISVMKPREVERLLNPMYCACVLAAYIRTYHSVQTARRNAGLPYLLLFLCLPLVLHAATRDEINKHTRTYSLHRLIRDHPTLLVGLAERVKGYMSVTQEAILFGINYRLLQLNSETITFTIQDSINRYVQLLEGESLQPIRAAERLGMWMAQLDVAEVFLHCGLYP